MAGIRFATCDPVMARSHIRKMYPGADPNRLDALTESGAFIDFVKADVIRVPDPEFHSGEIFPSKGFEESMRPAVIAACAEFHASAQGLCDASTRAAGDEGKFSPPEGDAS